MLSIQKIPIPSDSLLKKYTSIAGAYTDCYATGMARNVSFPEFIFAFYTTPLFRLERLILALTVFKPSADMEARQIADGTTDKFAAWIMEDRTENEILLCDFVRRTRSWLMAEQNETNTQLYFGSAVVPKMGETSLEFGYRALLGFHQVYSVLLLWSAKAKLEREG